ncbi:MAG: universal stress protein [Methylocystaceae bacterium]|nr:universal stress protein [Methylocystaceae bacterium]
MFPTVKNILCATDLAAESNKELEWAISEASRHSAQLHVVYVEQVSRGVGKMMGNYMGDEELKKMRHEGFKFLQKNLQAQVDKALENMKQYNVELSAPSICSVREGYTPEEITKYAQEFDVECLVIGTRTRNHSALGRFFLGSTAQNILQLSTRPVMVIPL